MFEIGELISKYLVAKNLSQSWLAIRIGMSPQCLGSKLRGRTRMSVEEFCDICAALHVEPNSFYEVYRRGRG